MMSSQKIEVGHTLKSKNAAAFLLFNPSGTSPRTSVSIILSKSSAGFAQIIYVQLQFFDHHAHNFIAKGLITYALSVIELRR
jgi:hypothetical protein